jgi:hypothetical protein
LGSVIIGGTTYQEGDYFTGDGTVPTGSGVYQMIDSVNSWFPMDLFFFLRFENRGINPSFTQYEHLFVKYAVARYLQEQSNSNYLQLDAEFEKGTALAELEKPHNYTNLRTEAFMANGTNRKYDDNENYMDWWD